MPDVCARRKLLTGGLDVPEGLRFRGPCGLLVLSLAPKIKSLQCLVQCPTGRVTNFPQSSRRIRLFLRRRTAMLASFSFGT